MNPLGISVVFVICSILLSFLKHMIFPSDEPPSTGMKFSKVFELTNNKVQAQPKYYKSLYEAYYRLQIDDSEKFTNKLANRSQFNQKVLSNSSINEQKSFVCAPDYLILLLSGVTVSQSGVSKWINTFRVYKLPLVTKISEINVNGRIVMPKECKKLKDNNNYQLGLITENGPALLIINEEDKVQLRRMSITGIVREYIQIDKFDFDEGCLAYWKKQQPWAIKIQQNSIINQQQYFKGNFLQNQFKRRKNSKQMILNSPLEINLLSIEMQRGKNYNQIQSMNILHLFAICRPQGLYLTVVYDYHNLGSFNKYVLVSSFLVNNESMSLLRHATLDIDHGTTATQCVQYFNKFKDTYDLSCTIEKETSQRAHYFKLSNIFSHSKPTPPPKEQNQTTKQGEEDDTISNWIDEHLDSIQGDEEENDFMWIIQSMTPLASKSYFHKQTIEYDLPEEVSKFISPSHSHMKIIKPTLPYPIIYYPSGEEVKLFTFNFVPEESQLSPLQFYTITPPHSDKYQQKYLRDISWIQDQNLILVVWGSSIEVYKYQYYDFPDSSGDGVAMSVILPFIELFATVFCLMRIIWNAD